MMYLPANLKKYRLQKELTQEDVADYLGITAQSVSKWERGESYPDITLLPALANIFFFLEWIQYGQKRLVLIFIRKRLHISEAENLILRKRPIVRLYLSIPISRE